MNSYYCFCKFTAVFNNMKKLLLSFIFYTLAYSFAQNTALFLDGAINYVDVGDLDVTGDQLTVEALIQYKGPSVNVISKHTNPGNVNYLLRIGSFELTTTNGFAAFGGVAAAGVSLVPNETYHVAATYNGQMIRYYVNGCLTGEMAWSGDMITNDFSTAIGQMSDCQCEQFDGYIDEVRIWNVARTQQQIESNMLDLPNPTTQAGLLAYYKFDGNFQNVQGNPQWDGVPIGNPQFEFMPDPFPHQLHLSAFSSDPLCANSNDGVIELAASGAYPPYEFSLDGTNFSANNTFQLGAGNYNVFVRPQNNNSCVVSKTITLVDSDPLLVDLQVEDITCFGDNNGSAAVTYSGGNGPDFSVEWSPSGSNADSINGLSPGNYSVTVKDSCQIFGSNLVVNGHFEDGNTGFTSDLILGSYGSSFLPGSYAVTFNPSLFNIGFQGSGSPNSGNFLVVDGSDQPNQNIWCQTIPVSPNTYYEFEMELASMLAISPAILSVEINGTPLPNTFEAPSAMNVWEQHSEFWFSGTASTAQICIVGINLDITGNDFGIDNISFKECRSCEETIPFEIQEPQVIVAAFTFSPESCIGAADGQINVSPSGGIAPYEISIDNGASFQPNQNFTGLESGTYAIVIRDANNCELDTTVQLTVLPSVTFDFTFIEPLCFGDNTGEITFTQVDGGTSPYAFSIDGGITTQVGQVFTSIAAGNYSLTVIDANGCSADVMPLELIAPDAITADISSTNLQCNNDGTGNIVINDLQGGNGNFQISIDGGTTFSNNTTFSNLQAGNYTIFIRDENDCVLTETLTITEPLPINASLNSQDVLCFGEASGQIIVTNISGGTAPLSFSIDGQNFQSSSTFSQLSAGNYTVTIQDANGCSIQQNAVVLSPTPLSLSSELNGVTCFGDCDATINVSASGGTTPYVFEWQDTQLLGAFRSDLCAGSYTIIVTDNNGCEISETFTIEEPDELTADFLLPNEKITVINSNVTFFNQSSGAIFYNWDFNGIGFSSETNPTFNFPEEPGEYFITLIAIGEGGCTDTITKTINIEDEVIFYVPNTFTPNGNQLNEVFTPVFTSGFDPFDFQMLIFNRWGKSCLSRLMLLLVGMDFMVINLLQMVFIFGKLPFKS